MTDAITRAFKSILSFHGSSQDTSWDKNLHRTANNSELRTIGLIKLKIDIKNISTFILAEVAVDLCTELVLGKHWPTQNDIDIITTRRCISKLLGSYAVTVPFSTYNQESSGFTFFYLIRILQKTRNYYTC
ncbi:unnamed protein product, partial [Rotaria sordida]